MFHIFVFLVMQLIKVFVPEDLIEEVESKSGAEGLRMKLSDCRLTQL